MDLGAAKLKAGAASAARTQVETIGQARKMDAANLGRGLVSNQATSAGLALNQGNSSASNMAATGGIAGQGAALMNSGLSEAQSGLAGATNTYGQITNVQNQANQASSGMWGALGSVGGAALSNAPALMAMSDENLKAEIEPVDPGKALEAVAATPVSNWAYKHGLGVSDGGQRHMGPMAQDIQKTMGNDVAPEGKKIDLIAMNGILTTSVQGLNAKVDKIMASTGLPH